jgi:hypothetical protein
MADGGYRWQGHAPAPDTARVEAIDAQWDDAGVETFAEPARAAAVERIEAALAAARAGDLNQAAARLADARSVLRVLDPDALEPRRGLAGLFDSRGRRLRDFRDGFRRAAAALSDAAVHLTERGEDAVRRSGALDAVWTDLRDAMVELDAHLLAVARRLSDPAPEEDGPHPLETRKAALDACRAAALGALPLVRGAQGADARAAEALKACADGVAEWRQGWTEALGLAGKRPKKRLRPDRDRLRGLKDDLLTRIDRAMAELTASGAHRAEVGSRLEALRSPL